MRLFGQKRIYLDYASAPPVAKEALKAMYAAERFVGNPGAIHAEGVEANAALGEARERIAALLGVKAREVIFTSGLTESNNLALLGYARSLERIRRTLEGTHWIVSAIEHTSVLDCFGEIERLGGIVTFVMPDSRGRITAAAIEAALRPETVLVSVGWANNEIGIVQQLAKIRAVLEAHERKHKSVVLLHSDAGQAPLYLKGTVHSLGVDMLALGSNKLYGPHGIGALYLHNRAQLSRISQGGPQERTLRPGTESPALALGFAAAFETVANEREAESKRLRGVRDEMAKLLKEHISGIEINGDLEYSLPHMLNISIPGIQSEYLTLALDRSGIAVSTKSACREGEASESHVVAALRLDSWRPQRTIRISLGRDTSRSDGLRAAETIIALVNKAAI